MFRYLLNSYLRIHSSYKLLLFKINLNTKVFYVSNSLTTQYNKFFNNGIAVILVFLKTNTKFNTNFVFVLLSKEFTDFIDCNTGYRLCFVNDRSKDIGFFGCRFVISNEKRYVPVMSSMITTVNIPNFNQPSKDKAPID
jgi:hypothetical protein